VFEKSLNKAAKGFPLRRWNPSSPQQVEALGYDTLGRLKRAASRANGWMPVGIPLNRMAAMMAQMRQMGIDVKRLLPTRSPRG
jgi:hypothetical protein